MPERRYKIGSAAKLTGLSPFLLRAWENRYELLRPSRTETGQRFYTEADVEMLRAVKSFLDKGYTIGEVASWDRSRLVANPTLEPAVATAVAPAAATPTMPSAFARQRDPGRAALFDSARRRLIDATTRFDQGAFDTTLAEALAAAPFDAVLAGLIIPVLEEIGELWESGELSVASEHFATACFKQRLLSMIQATSRSEGPLAVIAGAPGDYHEVGLLVGVYSLARLGWSVRYLGPNLPIEEFVEVMKVLRPGLVGLGLTLETDAASLSHWLAALRAASAPGTRLVCGGRGARARADVVTSAGFELDNGFEIADRRRSAT